MTLRYRIILGVVAFTLLPLGGAAVLVHRTLTRYLEQNAGGELQSRVAQTTSSLNAFVRQRQADLRIFATSPAVVMGTPAEVTARLEQLSLLSFFFEGLYFSDRQGRVVAATNAAAVDRPLATVFPELEPALVKFQNNSSRQVGVLDFLELPPEMLARAPSGGLTEKDLRMQLLTPVLDSAGRQMGMLMGLLRTGGLGQHIIDLEDQTVGNESAYLLSADGRILKTRDPRVQPGQVHRDWAMLRKALDGAKNLEGYVVYQDASGRKVLTGFARGEKFGDGAGEWVVLSTAPYDDIMAPAFSIIRGLTWFLLALLVVAVAVGLFAARSLLRPLEEVTEAARQLAAGQTEARAPVRGDTELALLARTFNEMADTRQQAEAGMTRKNEELQASDEKFHQLADHITDAFWIRSPDMQEVHYVSPGFERIWGRSRESLYANPLHWTDFILPQDRERVAGVFATLTDDAASSVDLEYRIVRPDDEIRWVRVRGFQVRDAANQVIRHTGIVTDITERRRADEKVQRLAAIVQNSADAIISKTLNGLITSWNPAAEIMFGYTAAEIIGRPLQVLIPQDRPHEEEEILAGLARGELIRHLETVRVRKDGRRFDVSTTISPIRDSDGKIVGAAKIVRDITEHKRAVEALRTSEAQFRTLAEAMPQMVWIARPDGWNTYFSQRWMDYTGLTAEETLGNGWDKPFHPEDRQRARDAWQHATTTTGTYSIECRLRRADGAYRWWLIRAEPLKDAAGLILKWFGTCTDIHDMKLAELEISRAKREIEQLNAGLEHRVERRTAALNAAVLEAERANEAKSEFLSRMSHELRTPMNAILGFAQLLETEEGLTGDQRESVDQILRGGGHLLGLINEVLDISSIEAGSLALSSEPVALAGMVEDTVSLLRPLSAELGIQISVLTDESAGLHVHADRQRLKQVLLNLLGNAIKYNRPGGSVTVRWATLEVSAGSGAEPVIRLSVTDTGMGLSAEKLARLFNPFERLGAEQTGIEGTGLGLVLARRMVEHMGGRLGVKSVAGEGSTFWVELRRTEPPAEPEEQFTAAVFPDAATSVEKRVLLYVEDNPANVRLVARILARRPGIDLLSAETGALGLSMAREHRPDLILLDLHLPDSHGTEVLARLAADPRTGAIPVVMLSADAVPGKRIELLAAGARAFITKPVDVRNFLSVVDQFLAREPVAAV